MSTFASSPDHVLRLLAPAKINLHLRIGPKRDDGFHSLLSWMTTVGLFDRLSLAVTSVHDREKSVVLNCDDPGLPCDGRNLVVKAVMAFGRQLWGDSQGKAIDEGAVFPGGGVSIHLEKRIPAGGGLGGGSSDAARTLLGLDTILGPDAGRPAMGARCLSELGLSLGSDVPFFLFGPSSVCKGRGEAVLPIGEPAGEKWVTLVLPPIGMPTADVYRRFDEMGLGRVQDLEQEPAWKRWVSLDSETLLPLLVNDLEAPAFSLRPELGELRDRLENSIGQPVRMSGSGSSLFTLFDDRDEAIDVAQVIASENGVRAIAVELAPMIADDLAV
jgi:4-diphosphocytidyl-2-C-methyl-D-erythritol kinase